MRITKTRIMKALRKTTTPLTQNELSIAIDMSRGGVSDALKGLIEDGEVKRIRLLDRERMPYGYELVEKVNAHNTNKSNK